MLYSCVCVTGWIFFHSYCVCVVVTVVLEETAYSVAENAQAVDVCAVVQGASEETVTATISTSPGSALGEHFFIHTQSCA